MSRGSEFYIKEILRVRPIVLLSSPDNVTDERTLRDRLIRLAYTKPHLRPDLLPILKTKAAATPRWPGADAVYSYLYRVLERMGKENWQAEVARAKKKRSRPKPPRPTDDMEEIMKALDGGDEETLKGIQMRYKTRRYV